MITLLVVGDSIRSFSETFRDKYQSVFFASASTLSGYLAIRPDQPSILVLSEFTDQGLSYTDILFCLREKGWHKQPPVIVLIDEFVPRQANGLIFSSPDPHHLDKIIQHVARVNFSLDTLTEG